MRLCTYGLMLLMSLGVWSATAQQKAGAAPPPPPEGEDSVIKADVELVNVLFSVRNKQNGLISNLNKEDFTLFENGQKQEIKYFTRETDLPLTIGLLVDVSASQEALIDIERRAALQFFSQLLRKKDMAFLISFGSEAELLQDYTNSAQLLRKGMDDLRVNSSPVGFHPGPVPTASQPRGTILYDSIYLAADEKLRGEVGRKVIVVITDGVDQGSRKSLQDAIAAAHKADAIVYGIYYVDSRFYGFGGGGGEGTLKKMAEETGGRVFRIDRKLPLDAALKQIEEEMRSQYAVAYSPTNPQKDGTFRKVEIRPAEKDLKVQARKGYFATKSDSR